MASDLSFTWLVLLLMSLFLVSSSFWAKDIKLVLFFGFVFASSINITKALIVEGGIYTPGLSISLFDIFLMPLLFLWILEKKLFSGEKIYWSKLHFFPLLFLLWLWISVSYSEDKFAGFLMCISYTKFFIIYVFICDYVSSPKHLRIMLYAVALALLAHFSLAFLEIIFSGQISVQGTKTTTTGVNLVFENAGGVHAFRPSGFAGHPNAFADLLVFVLPVCLALLITGQKYIGRAVWLATAALFVAGGVFLLLTLSRAGWISFAAACVYLLYFGNKKGIVPRRYINRLILVSVVSGVLAVLIYPTVYLRITESDQRSSESRIAMMHQSALIIQRNPVMGVGIAGYNRAARANIPEYFSNLNQWFQAELLKGIVHNKYLLVMSETGTIGLVLFLLTLWRFVSLVPKSDFWTEPVYLALALGISAGIFGQTVFYLFDHFYSDPRITMMYIYFGILTAIVKLQSMHKRSLKEASVCD